MADFLPTGDAEIDSVRRDVLANKTTAENYIARLSILRTWMMFLQRRGADTRSYVAIDTRRKAATLSGDLAAVCGSVDDAFAAFESLEEALSGSDKWVPQTSDADGSSRPTDSGPHNWPLYQGDIHHSGRTTDSGPRHGRIAWSFPVGLAWYARPVVESGKVYVASPGMRTLVHCLDLESGARIWRTSHDEVRYQGGTAIPPHRYHTRSICSTPVIVGDELIVGELGAQANRDAARDFVVIDKTTGSIVRRLPGGNLDYRAGHAAFLVSGEYLVYPHGRQEITTNPPSTPPQDRIACRDLADGSVRWDFTIGPVYGDPVADGDRILVGTADGYLSCLRVAGSREIDAFQFTKDTERIRWSFRAGGAINSSPAVDETAVFFGANDGAITAVDKNSGSLLWRHETNRLEERAFRLFSTPAITSERVYIGSADRSLLCLDKASGREIWRFAAADWIRARPLVHLDRIYAVGLDGTLMCLRDLADRAEVAWSAQMGPYPVFADPVAADGAVLVVSSDLVLHCFDATSGELRWQFCLLETTPGTNGGRLLVDEMASGAFYQSKPTVADGTVFVGGPSRMVSALESESGRLLWRFEIGAAVSAAPAWADGLLYFGAQGGEEHYYCVDAQSGRLVWKQAVGWAWSSANVDQGRVFVPAVDGYLTCLDAQSGTILWRYRTSMACHPEPVVEGRTVVFGSWDQHLYGLDTLTGGLRWKFNTGGAPDSGAPTTMDGRLYVPTGVGSARLCCLDAETGELIWERETPGADINVSPAISGQLLVASERFSFSSIPIAGTVIGMDKSTGRKRWELPGGGLTGASLSADRIFYASTCDPFFTCARETEDGKAAVVWRCRMGDRVDESMPALYGRHAYILCSDGLLYAFE